uniref:GPS domain-containing protein n=1 Tax=Strongyloides stercoralis TaxID=6248 RepID=A0A0K0EGZ6_STRER
MVIYFYLPTSVLGIDKEVTICDGLNVTLQCDETKIINFTMANYGRFAIEVCNDPNDFKIPDEKLCKNDKTLPILEKLCQGQSICSFNVNNKIFDDTCIGSPKYLVARYNCIEKIIPTTTTTQKTTTELVQVNIHLMEDNEYAKVVSHKEDTRMTNIGITRNPSKIIAKIEENFGNVIKNCPKTTRRLITWPETHPGKKARVDCPIGSFGLGEWYCSNEGKWEPSDGPSLLYCKSTTFNNLAQDLEEIDPTESKDEIRKAIEILLEETVKNLKIHTTVFGGDLMVIGGIISKITDQFQFLDDDKESAGIIVDRLSDVIDVLLKPSNEFWSDLNEELRKKLLMRILENYEKMLLKILVPSERKNVANSKTILKENFLGISTEVLKHSNAKYPSESVKNFQDNIMIPDEIIEKYIDTMTFVSYNGNISKIFGGYNFNNTNNIFSTNIISVSLYDGKKRFIKINDRNKNYTYPFVIELQLKEKMEHSKTIECINYDEEQGLWSNKNCILSSIKNDQIICHCSILGKISSVIIDNNIDDITSIDGNNYIQLIVIISCVIGIFFMIMTLFSVFVFYSTSTYDKGQTIMLRNITITYIFPNILILVFFATPTILSGSVVCSISTILTQFFILSFLLWIIIISYQLMIEISHNYTGPSNLALFIYNTIAYILPLFISFGSAYWYQSSIGIDSWKVSEFCFHNISDNFIIGYGIPIAIVIVINAIFSIILLCTIFRRSTEGYSPCKQDTLTNFKNIKNMSKGIILTGIFASIILVPIHFYVEIRNPLLIYLSCSFNIILSCCFFIYFVVTSESMAYNYNQWVLRNEWLPKFFRESTIKNIENNSRKMILSSEGETPVLFPETFSNNMSPAHFSFSPSCVSTYTYSGDKSLLCSNYKSHITSNISYQQNPSPFSLHNNDQKICNNGTMYDYPSISFDKPNYIGTFSTANTLINNNKNQIKYHYMDNNDQNNGHPFIYPIECISPNLRTTPPKFPPPPPPQYVNGSATIQYKLNQGPVTMSEDSAYSDSGSSTFIPPIISNGVPLVANYTSGSMVLRMDLNKKPPVFLSGNNN